MHLSSRSATARSKIGSVVSVVSVVGDRRGEESGEESGEEVGEEIGEESRGEEETGVLFGVAVERRRGEGRWH